MENIIGKIDETSQFLSNLGFANAEIGIVMGTGLAKFIEKMEIEQSLPYHQIPHFPTATVEFHKGQLLLGNLDGKKLIVMQGRFHYYEGYSMQEVTFPIRVMKKIGISALLLSNAAGGINAELVKGDLVLLNDHINLQPENPLRGLNDPAFGNRYVDMFEPYDGRLNELFLQTATKMNIPLKRGVYVAVVGPNLETRAEYKYLQMIGADVVGMSTVPEVIVANHIGLRCAAVCVVTDECQPGRLQPVNIEEILRVAAEGDIILSELLAEVVKSL